MPGTCELCGEEKRPVFGWSYVDEFGQRTPLVHACQPCIDQQENDRPLTPIEQEIADVFAVIDRANG